MIRRRYGARLAHLAGHLALAGVLAFVLAQVLRRPVTSRPLDVLLWLLGGAVLHDVVLLPAYSLADRIARRSAFLRVPLATCGALLLVYAPRILDRQPRNYENALGHPPPNYLARWLAACGVVFAISALLYAGRRLRTWGRP